MLNYLFRISQVVPESLGWVCFDVPPQRVAVQRILQDGEKQKTISYSCSSSSDLLQKLLRYASFAFMHVPPVVHAGPVSASQVLLGFLP